MKALIMSLLNCTARTAFQLVLLSVFLSFSTISLATPDDWVAQLDQEELTIWNFYVDLEEQEYVESGMEQQTLALSCLPNVNISLGQDGSALITALTLVNAPEYPANQYVVDIMGPLTNTVYCAQLGQYLMVLVTELPTGNACMSTIYVEDKLRPVFACTPDILPCNVDIQTIDFENYLEPVTDNCDNDLTLWYSYVIQNLPCNPQQYTQQVLVTWTATDDSGNSATCVDIIYLRKPSLGEVVFPPNVSVSCVNANTDPSNTGVPTYNGQPIEHTCQYVVFHTDVIIPMCNGAYKIRRTWTVKDWCTSGQVTHVQEILVVDNTPPNITCPSNITVSTSPGVCTTKYTLPLPVVSDACANPNQIDIKITVSGIPGIFIPGQMVNLALGTTLITMRATDPCGNSRICQYSVTVRDNVPPVIICPPNVTLDCLADTSPANTGSATAIDACDNTPTITYTDGTVSSQNCALGYTITRTWRATDDSGNTATCMQMIVLTDNTPPAITCPANVTITCTASTSPANTGGSATATDICDQTPTITFTQATTPGSCPQEYTINRTWRATDDCGNSSTCLQVIVVVDNTPPTIDCPPDITIMCAESTDPDEIGFATASDLCDPSPEITYADEDVPAGPNEFMKERTWTATDACGNTSTCIQYILINDSTPPGITCPANVTIHCDDSTLPGNTGMATASDNCDPAPNITYTDSFESGDCTHERVISRTWVVEDESGNTASCVQDITIQDTEAPVVTCPANITIQCTANTLPGNTGNATASDNCDTTPTINFSDNIVNGSCPQESTINRTWTAQDDCGNSSTCLQIITVDDSVAPSITCPGDITISCSASTLPGNTGSATASDNCDVSPAITFVSVTADGACPQAKIITRTWTATDDCGNTSTCIQIITTVDTNPPLLTCPGNITIACTASTLPPSTGVATAIDNCDSAPVVNFSDTSVGGSCPQELTIARTWTATDGCGNSTACIQIIIVSDDVAPIITCPANTTIECTESTLPANTGSATAIDLCDNNPTISFTDISVPGGCPDEFSITRTWRATDDCGNSSTCVQTIIVLDSTAPVITCPAAMTISCDESSQPVNTGSATAADNCDSAPDVNFSDTTLGGSCPEELTISRTWTATDACGNSSTCLQLIVVVDEEAPAIFCPVDVTILCGESTEPANTGTAGAEDNCDNSPAITFTDETGPDGCMGNSSIIRTWVATDNCGNSSACIQLIALEDTVPPDITCPGNLTIECDENTLPVNTGQATATDNCMDEPVITFSDITTSGSCEQELLITRTWTATDGCGNSSTCVQSILLEDTTPPAITCPSDITIDCADSTLPANTGSATAIDVCDANPGVTFEDEIIDGGNNCPEAFNISRTWIATDDCGNSSTCVQLIIVNDLEAPSIVCPPDVTIDCNDSTLPEDNGFATADDNCDTAPSVDYSDVTIGGGCPFGYIITRTWIATDACGNTSTCDQIISIDDNIEPLVTCPSNATISCTASTGPDNTGVASATDNCDSAPGVGFSDVTVGGACPQEYTITRTWIGTDACGNSGTCSQTIIVEDNIAPVCVAMNITVSINGNGMVTILASEIDAGSSDNCGPVTLSVSPETFTCDDIGDNLVVLTVTDCPGNSSTCTATVTVEDNGGLQALCQNVIITVDVNGNASVDPLDVDNGSGGGCVPGDLEYELDQTDFNCTDLGPNVVTLTVTDEEGNTATCTAFVTVVDLIPPVITCPQNITLACNTVTDPNNTDQFGIATATDNCSFTSITETHVLNLNDCGVGTIVRTFVATDGSNNTSSCVQIVTINNPNPFDENDITWPDSPVNVNICNSTNPPNIPNGVPVFDPASLQCANPVATFVDVVETFIDNDPNTPCKIITRTWTVTDNCQANGTFVFVQTINVTDAVPPLFTNINDMTKVANPNCVAPFTLIASATDCAGVTITNNSPYGVNTGANASGNYPIGVTVVIFTATDGCGNISTMDVVITVTDNDPTQMQCEKHIFFLPIETEITIAAEEFVTLIAGGCTDADDVIVSYSGTNPFDTLRTYDCGDVGVSTFSLWLWNAAGTMILDMCNTADLDLRDPNDFCQDGFSMSGQIKHEDGHNIADVEVSIINAPMVPDTTNLKGVYVISGLNEGVGYAVAPYEDRNHREGVSTLDLVMIQKHLLGKAKLNSPYKIIAADANKSGHVTALDLIEIRRLILGITTRFPNNTSWRFVDRDYSFIDPYNPFTPQFPESIWFDSITSNVDTANFIGIKIGDVNGSFFKSRASGEEILPRTLDAYNLSINHQTDSENENLRWVVEANPGQGLVNGVQLCFHIGKLSTEQLSRITSDMLTDDQWYYHPGTAMIYISWSSAVEVDLSGKVLMSIPDVAGALTPIEVKSTALNPEAYEAIDQEIQIREIKLSIGHKQEMMAVEYQLFHNIPNPFSERTQIRYALPGDEMIVLVIHDVTGRQVFKREEMGHAGMNEIIIKKQDIGAPGIYYYTLYTQNASFTHKMSLTND